jgi:hypothetical protein
MPADTIDLLSDTELDSYQRMGEKIAASLNGSVKSALETGRLIRADWRSCCDAVAAGNTPTAHARRGGFEARVESALPLFRRLAAKVDRAVPLLPHEIKGVAELSSLIDWLERFNDKVLKAWTGPEALEELAGEHYPLSSADLDVLAARYPAPVAWYEEEGKPF